MTPTEIVTMARQLHNVVGDTFWTDTELYKLLTLACRDLANKANVIQRIFTTTSVSGTREYAYPSYARRIRRVEYGGKRLDSITIRDDDKLTFRDSDTTDTGEPSYYAIWNRTLYLRPTPDTDGITIKVYTYAHAQEITSTSVMEIPEFYHMQCVYFLIANMALKEKNFELYREHMAQWRIMVAEAIQDAAREKRADRFAETKTEDVDSLAGPYYA